jgi:hypothetical protein
MQAQIEFLENHKNADEIVVDQSTGQVVEARYLWLDGRVREIPAIYRYPEY